MHKIVALTRCYWDTRDDQEDDSDVVLCDSHVDEDDGKDNDNIYEY